MGRILNIIYNNRVERKRFSEKLYRFTLAIIGGGRVVDSVINGQKAKMPFEFSGSYFQTINPLYDRQLARICCYLKNVKTRGLNIMDVGANIGDTVLNIGDTENRYFLVEGERSFSKYIEYNLKDYNYQLVCVFAGEQNLDVGLKVIKDHGTASIIEDTNSKDNYKIHTIDAICAENHFEPDLIKVDTDGFDFKVLKGAKTTLDKLTPIIFFEWTLPELLNNNEDPIGIYDYLFDLGYEDSILFDNFGNLFCQIKTNQYNLLGNLINYTRTNKINYFDVCAINARSGISASDLYRYLEKYGKRGAE